MTSPTQPKSTQVPVLLVYGTPTSPELTQASWFRVEDKEAANVAAEALKFSVIDIQTDAEKALTVGVHEGVLKGSGRMIVGSVSSDVYRRIDKCARKAAGTDAASKPANTREQQQYRHQNKPRTRARRPLPRVLRFPQPLRLQPIASSEPRASLTSNAENVAAAPVNPWDTLRVGSYVIAKYPDESVGWWPAIITAIDKRDFIIRWTDEPRTIPSKIKRKHVAIIRPDLDVSGK